MARSVGEAISQGLESGLRIGTGLVDRRLAQERQAEQDRMAREDRGLAMADREERRTRQRRADGLAALDAQLSTLTAEGARFQPGDTSPEAQDWTRRFEAVQRQRGQTLADAGGYDFDADQREAQADIQLFQTAPDQAAALPPARRVRAIVAATGRPVGDFLRADGKPSKIGGAIQDFSLGLMNGDQLMMLASANTILGPELQKGVGAKSPHGGVIVGKAIERFDPNPNKPDEFIPTVRVYVRKDDDPAARAAEEWLRRTDPNAPEGATAYYLAPLTERRSTDPDDPVRSVSLGKTKQYLEALRVMEESLNDPAVAPEIMQSTGQWDQDRFLRARSQSGLAAKDREQAEKEIDTGLSRQLKRAQIRATEELGDQRQSAANWNDRRPAQPRGRSGGGGTPPRTRVQSTRVGTNGNILLIMSDGSVKDTGQKDASLGRAVANMISRMSKDSFEFRELPFEEQQQRALDMLGATLPQSATPAAAPAPGPAPAGTPDFSKLWKR